MTGVPWYEHVLWELVLSVLLVTFPGLLWPGALAYAAVDAVRTRGQG